VCKAIGLNASRNQVSTVLPLWPGEDIDDVVKWNSDCRRSALMHQIARSIAMAKSYELAALADKGPEAVTRFVRHQFEDRRSIICPSQMDVATPAQHHGLLRCVQCQHFHAGIS